MPSANRKGDPVRASGTGNEDFVFAEGEEGSAISLGPWAALHIEGAKLRLEIVLSEVERAMAARAPFDNPVHVRRDQVARLFFGAGMLVARKTESSRSGPGSPFSKISMYRVIPDLSTRTTALLAILYCFQSKPYLAHTRR